MEMVQKWYSNGTGFVHCRACSYHGNGAGMVQDLYTVQLAFSIGMLCDPVPFPC